ncbi:MAG: sugar nucleotide-binding protein [Oscillospiraceae bacterium]|nr:sugar nucleotide-binding protein [Oscillospiraceae bacterium]
MYIVIGAGGFLGSHIVKNIISATDEGCIAVVRDKNSVTETDRAKSFVCDVTKKEDIKSLSLYIKGFKQIKCVYLAAYHNIDKVEENADLAYNVNVEALENFLNAVNIESLFFSSTDAVYGEGGPDRRFKETDELNPVNIYGEQKILAEKLTLEYGGHVLRLPLLMGKSLSLHKKHFYDTLEERLIFGQKTEMFTDFVRSALDYGTTAGIIAKLCETPRKNLPKILNIGGDRGLSKYDIGIRLCEKLGADKNLVIPAESDNSGVFSAKRAEYALLDNGLLKNVLDINEICFDIFT